MSFSAAPSNPIPKTEFKSVGLFALRSKSWASVTDSLYSRELIGRKRKSRVAIAGDPCQFRRMPTPAIVDDEFIDHIAPARASVLSISNPSERV